jgi:hypothetical protein
LPQVAVLAALSGHSAAAGSGHILLTAFAAIHLLLRIIGGWYERFEYVGSGS